MPTKADTKGVDVRELLKAGAHFGHKSRYWNPAMKPFIHSKRGGIYIIDLIKTAGKLSAALEFVESTAATGKQILFVGTKRHISQLVKDAAIRAGMPYVSEHWYGGMLTNFDTFQSQIKRLKELEEQSQSGELGEARSKRETSELKEEIERLNLAFGGIKDMDKLPAALYVTDVVTEKTAVREANRLGIPVAAIVDTNGDPSTVDYVIPANDDAVSAVSLISNAIADAVSAGAAAAKKSSQPKETADKPAKAASSKED